MKNSADFIIIGAGIMGLAIARELKIQFPHANILMFEKEKQIGLHSSGRNSGVLHSGIYYPENSFKAKVCADGAIAMANYCEQHKLPINRLGKIILPTQCTQEDQLELLYQRARNNNARVEIIDEIQLKAIEPEANSATGKALWCPDTAVINSKAILSHLAASLENIGVTIKFQSKLEHVLPNNGIRLNGTDYYYQHLFNTTGLNADVVAIKFGIADKYTILPFKGTYYRLDSQANITINKLIYPVPDLNVPFLGVHFTKLINGDVMVGPSAIPVLGRENYRGLKGINWEDGKSILFNLFKLYVRNQQGFRNYAHTEITRIFKSRFTEAARTMIPKINIENLLPSDKVGIRAQLFSIAVVSSGDRIESALGKP